MAKHSHISVSRWDEMGTPMKRSELQPHGILFRCSSWICFSMFLFSVRVSTMNHRKFPADYEMVLPLQDIQHGTLGAGCQDSVNNFEVGSHRSTWNLLVPKIFGVC